MSRYRTHTCVMLNKEHAQKKVRLAGWVHRKRDHGNLVFIDLRDHFGVTQCVVTPSSPAFAAASELKSETVITCGGEVRERTPENVNPAIPTGTIEVYLDSLEVISAADVLPFQVAAVLEPPEEQRLRFRFLDLRREKLHHNIVLRSKVIASLRRRMMEQGFNEFQTPILTSSSPEGARDYLVPSRVHPGKFYALPQAPQQFKQLLMVAGFDRYFQIAPCFRDEDARADRSPGEFYQLDVEMSFVEQDDVFSAIEPVLHGVYKEFTSYEIAPPPFPRIAYDDAMVRYGTDKPDLRNPIQLSEATSLFEKSDFAVFANAIAKGSVVRAIPAPKAAGKPRSFFDKTIEFGQSLGLPGVAYVILDAGGALKGTIAKFFNDEMKAKLTSLCEVSAGDAVFFICEQSKNVAKPASEIRCYLGKELDAVEKNVFRFCWVVDFPFYELDDDGKVAFAHNPFSMPQGGLDALKNKEPLTIKAFQYDIVCNGIELSSGAIRNHSPELMLKAFEIAGYTQQDVENRFGGMLNAFRHGAPPHGGLAPGVDRMVMQIANEPNIREVIAFPMTQQAQDLMMQAPSTVTEKQLRELNLRVVLPEKHKG
ncbi:MAG: aspartate--tRNA ligase [Myxococcaceae bacterium]